MMACSTCDRFRDTDTDVGNWDVPCINSIAKLDYICGACGEKYINEDGQYDPDLEDRMNEAAYDRQQAADMESPPVTMDEQHAAAWKQKQGLR